MRAAVVVTSALLVASCAVQSDAPSSNANWRRVSGVEAGCVEYAPRNQELVDRNILPTPEFARLLVSQLDPADRTEPLCWYETPQGLVRLFAGEWCSGGTESDFEELPQGWLLVSSRMVSIACNDGS